MHARMSKDAEVKRVISMILDANRFTLFSGLHSPDRIHLRLNFRLKLIAFSCSAELGQYVDVSDVAIDL